MADCRRRLSRRRILLVDVYDLPQCHAAERIARHLNMAAKNMNTESGRDEKAECFLVSDIKSGIDASVHDVYAIAAGKLRALGGLPDGARYAIFRRSVDARKKNEIRLVWTVSVCGAVSPKQKEKYLASGIRLYEAPPLDFPRGNEKLSAAPVIVGTGPAGMFAGLLLAENGYRPHLIERGGTVDERVDAVDRFLSGRILDPDTNIQFGAGGAGTFSDGKLMTRINDRYIHYILETFVRFGAPPEILTQARPHIGTDILRCVVKNILTRIEDLGGRVDYHTEMLDILPKAKGGFLRTAKGDIPYGALVLACGHSARNTYSMLLSHDFRIEPKPFSVGVRVEHLQADIDRAVYGKYAGHPALGHAEYALSCNTDKRGVYTFCMCPGGVVIAAASEPSGVVVNGMSYHARSGKNANSAVAVSVRTEDYGATPQKAILFQQEIERKAFLAAGGDYSAPLVTMGDFLREKAASAPSRIQPTYMGGSAWTLCLPDNYLPAFITDGLRDAFVRFDKNIHGFAGNDALITGPETRTSAPVRILRGEDLTAPGFDAIYPCGEGAGYAGGITSAAADGIRCAAAIIGRFGAAC